MTTTTTNIIAQIQNRKNGNQGWSLEDLFKQSDAAKAADVTRDYADDILALSCCLQRITQNLPYGSRFNRSLTSSDLPENLTDLDRQKAKNIREYYKNKLLMLTLRENNLTKFRKDLQNFLYSEPTKVLDSHCGIVYKLPYFYDYDMEVDGVF